MQLTREWAKQNWLWAIAAFVVLAAFVGVSSVAAQPSTPDYQAMVAACQAFMAQAGTSMSSMMSSMGSGVGPTPGMMGGMGGMGGMGLR